MPTDSLGLHYNTGSEVHSGPHMAHFPHLGRVSELQAITGNLDTCRTVRLKKGHIVKLEFQIKKPVVL